MRDVIIIGSGPSGYTAAIYAARAGLYPIVFEGDIPGGQLTLTHAVENYPGFPEGVEGPELMARMRKQAERFGAKIVAERVTAVDFSAQPLKVFIGEKFETAKTVIIATGGKPRRLGLDSETALYGRGVSTCATCDAYFFRGKRVAIVGGGDSALEEADFLTRFAEKVTVLVRRDQLRASPALQARAKGNHKIDFIWNVLVEEVLGVDDGRVRGVKLKDAKSGEIRELELDGLFVVIGHDPNTEMFQKQLNLDEVGYVVTGPGALTSVPGVFACGDVQDPNYRQAITAAGAGCRAAIDALRFIESNR